MKFFLFILFSFFLAVSFAQHTNEEKLIATVKEFHQALVNKNTVSLNQQTDKALSYGHSNGWVQNKKDLINDLKTGLISYQSFKEDSIEVNINGNVANVRFKAGVEATMKGTAINLKLSVLEVWIRKSKRWVLFARQGVKA
ncbi:MAG: nuclear transport factor 2 family protein [Bacteroidota bacterium]